MSAQGCVLSSVRLAQNIQARTGMVRTSGSFLGVQNSATVDVSADFKAIRMLSTTERRLNCA